MSTESFQTTIRLISCSSCPWSSFFLFLNFILFYLFFAKVLIVCRLYIMQAAKPILWSSNVKCSQIPLWETIFLKGAGIIFFLKNINNKARLFWENIFEYYILLSGVEILFSLDLLEFEWFLSWLAFKNDFNSHSSV